MQWIAFLEQLSRPLKIILALALVSLIGFLDYLTGSELAFSLFYIIPVAFTTWLLGRRLGIAIAGVSALTWGAADLAGGNHYSSPWIPAWNTMIRLSFFVIITLLLAAQKASLEREKAIARLDYLTGAANTREFYSLLQREIERAQRYQHPFTLVYLDLDNFKAVNDRYGHAAGDDVLRMVVKHLRQHLRRTDALARLGGDEFALLLPETDPAAAHILVSRLQAVLVQEMHGNGWPVTCSLGVLCCAPGAWNPQDLIRTVDQLMYTVKSSGKDDAAYARYPG